MSVIRKEIKKLVFLSAYFYKVSKFFFVGGGGEVVGVGWEYLFTPRASLFEK